MYSSKYDRIIGRWSGKSYTLLKRLGKGGIGEIYLVADDYGHNYAMKISQDLLSITKEYDNLVKFKHLCFAPKVYEIDDYEKENKVYHFFIMEYIEGYTLREALSKKKLNFGNKIDIARIITGILKEVNAQGYIYTDLKQENIMIDIRNGIIRFIDLGSITPTGSRVKEYTPMYDRSSWNAGSRTADSSYQVFAIIMLLTAMLLNKDINPDKERLERILEELRKCGFPASLYDTIRDCICGNIDNCGSLCDRLGEICQCSVNGRKLTYVLNAVITLLAVLLAVLIKTVFA